MAALGLRAVQLYHHPSQKAQADAAVARARKFLESRAARDTEERSYQLLGLRWALGAEPPGAKAAGADRAALRKLAAALQATQRPDGGWSSIPGRESDVYSTGQALVALHDGGSVAIIDSSWQRGIAWLLKTQAADGTWHVTSRLHPPAPLSPPYFDAGYPHGHDQFLSMQGASWAVMALSYALEPATRVSPPPLPETEPFGVEPWVQPMLFGSVPDVRKLLDDGLSPNAATTSGGTTAPTRASTWPRRAGPCAWPMPATASCSSMRSPPHRRPCRPPSCGSCSSAPRRPAPPRPPSWARAISVPG
jgi:hypothetical protein